MKNKFLATVMAIAIIASLAACGSANKTAETEGEKEAVATEGGGAAADGSTADSAVDSGKKTKLTAAVMSFESLNPYKAVGHVIIQIGKPIYEPLFCEYDGELKGVMAKTINIVDDYTVDCEIYDYIYDQAGNHITADDVVFSFETMKAAATMAVKINVEKTGDYSVRIVSEDKIYPSFLDGAAFYIVSKAAYDEAKFVDEPVGTGKYKVTEFVSGSKLVLEKIDNHWQTDESLVPEPYKARVDVIEYDVLTESGQIQTALEMGTIQCSDISIQAAEAFKAGNEIQVQEYTEKYPGLIMFNMKDGVFSDNLALRQAVLYAIDLDGLALAVTQGTGHKAYTIGNESLNGYQAKWENEDYYDYDVEKAKSMLSEAGYQPGELTIKILTGSSESNTLPVQIIQSYLHEIGIEATIDALDNTTYIAQRTAYTGTWDICYNGLVPKGYFMAGAKMVADNTSYEEGNMFGANDPKLQELFEAALYSNEADAIDAFHQYVKENAYLYGLSVGKIFYGLHPGIKQMVFSCDGEICPQAFILSDDYNIFAE